MKAFIDSFLDRMKRMPKVETQPVCDKTMALETFPTLFFSVCCNSRVGVVMMQEYGVGNWQGYATSQRSNGIGSTSKWKTQITRIRHNDANCATTNPRLFLIPFFVNRFQCIIAS